MDEINLTPRPEKSADTLTELRVLAVASCAGCALLIGMGLRASGPIGMVFAAVGFAVLVSVGLIVFAEWQDKRDYPRRLREHLARPLEPEDYERLDRIARWHPEVKPWIAEVMCPDGQIYYRDAERLQTRINQHLRALPRKQLQDRLRNEHENDA